MGSPLGPTFVITFTKLCNGKLTFCGVYRHFESFLTFTYMFDIVYTLACKCFQICSSWTKLHIELFFLKQISLENVYPENVMNKCFKRFMDNIRVVKNKTRVNNSFHFKDHIIT